MFLLHNCILYRSFKRLKVIVEFKHVRFKSFMNAQINNSKDACKHRIQILADMLKCNVFTAHEIAARNKNIFALNHQDFNRNVIFCKNYLKLSDVIEFPVVLGLNSSLLQHRYFSLKELGCPKISASYIFKFPHILKQTPKTLQKEGISFSYGNGSDVLDVFLDSSESSEINSKLQNMYEDGSSLWQIKERMNAEFLVAKLGCSIGRAHQMFHSYPPLRVQSILNTDHLLNILLQKFGFSVSMIFKSANLLSLHHETIEHFISEVPDILGIKTENLVRKLPLILRQSVDSIQRVEAILKDFNITDAQLMCCPKVIVFTANTVKKRLTTLCNSEDFALLKSYKKFLWLVYYFNNLNSRLEALKAMNIPCSISMFTVSKSDFSKYLCVSECRTHINDICFYIANVFNMAEKDILPRLREYPNYQNCSLINSRKVVEFLIQCGVTKRQLFNGIGIIFYDIDVVKVYFEDLKNHPECQPFEEWVIHYNLIQLLIYTIEVDTGFQGSRLYKTTSKIDEKEELLSTNYFIS